MRTAYAIILPTRRCNLACTYCAASSHHPPTELSPEEWQQALPRLEALLDPAFTLFLGGDVTIWGLPALEDFVNFLSRRQWFYAFTSNSVLIDRTWADRLVAAGLSNWSVSLDALAFPTQEGRAQKALAAQRALSLFRERGVPDLHCTVTVAKDTLTSVVEVVRYLTGEGVWAEIAPYLFAHDHNYDYTPPWYSKFGFQESDYALLQALMGDLLALKRAGALIHNTDAYLTAFPDWAIRADWRCQGHLGVTLDADGSFKPCLHLRGNRSRAYKLQTLTYEQLPALRQAMADDRAEQCRGCFWNCQWEAEHIYALTGSLQEVRAYFAHSGGTP